MDLIDLLIKDIKTFSRLFDLVGTIVISVNVLLMIFARRILHTFYHDSNTSPGFRYRVNIFRTFNVLIVVLYAYYNFYSDADEDPVSLKSLSIIVVLYLCYVGSHIAHYIIQKRFGKVREIDGKSQYVETYNSRILSLFTAIVIFIIAFVSVIQLLGFDSLLEAGGAIGIVGVFLALTQSAWAPDMFSGLIILNSRMMEVGDVIEFNDGDTTLGVVYKTKVFHTEILNLINNHRIMIKNDKLRQNTIHNLSKFASSKGLRELLTFNIDYNVDESKVRSMLQLAFDSVVADVDVSIMDQFPVEVGVLDTGDHAVKWGVYYYTKDIKRILSTRQKIREHVLKTAKSMSISLATPVGVVHYNSSPVTCL